MKYLETIRLALSLCEQNTADTADGESIYFHVECREAHAWLDTISEKKPMITDEEISATIERSTTPDVMVHVWAAHFMMKDLRERYEARIAELEAHVAAQEQLTATQASQIAELRRHLQRQVRGH